MTDRPSATPSARAREAAREQLLQEQVQQLRQRTIELRTYALEVAQRARSTQRGVACSHATELEQVQQRLTDVQAELDGLRTAMNTRGVIEQAKGMLMAQRHIDADDAFDILVRLSQTTHRKLVDVARQLVESWKAPEHGPS